MEGGGGRGFESSGPFPPFRKTAIMEETDYEECVDGMMSLRLWIVLCLVRLVSCRSCVWWVRRWGHNGSPAIILGGRKQLIYLLQLLCCGWLSKSDHLWWVSEVAFKIGKTICSEKHDDGPSTVILQKTKKIIFYLTEQILKAVYPMSFNKLSSFLRVITWILYVISNCWSIILYILTLYNDSLY